MNFWMKLFDTSDFPARWNCGNWTAGHGWLHILSDLAIWSAYFAIPCVLIYFGLQKKDLPFRKIFLLFGAFILLCGTTHLMEAIIFWWPAYRLAGLIKFATATVSWLTVLALLPLVPRVLSMKSPEELEQEITARKAAEFELKHANESLEQRVAERTAELARVNESLWEEREWFRTTLTSIGDAVITTDTAGRVTIMNQVSESLTGWSFEEAKGQPLSNVFNIINQQTREPVENPALRALNEGAIIGLANHTILISKEGQEYFIDDSAAPIKNDSRAIVGAVLIFRDISEKYRAEMKLRESEAKFTQLADAIPQLAWMADPEGNIYWYNSRWYEYTGTTLEQMQGWGWQSVHDPATLDSVLEKWKSSLQSGKSFSMVFPLRGADGELRPFLTMSVPFRDEEGNIIRWFGTNTDISKIRQIEEELQEARSRMESTLAAAEIGTWEYDPTNNVVRADANLIKMFDVDAEAETALPIEIFLKNIHPDDQQRVSVAIEKALTENESYEEEYQVLNKGSELRWVIARGRVERNPETQLARLSGVVVDITQQKMAEQALINSEEQLKLVLDSAELGSWHLNPETKELQTDERFREIFGVTSKTMTYQEAIDIIPPEDRERVLAAVEISMNPENPVPYSVEHRVIRPDGETRWVFVKGRVNIEETGDQKSLASFDGTVMDITEQWQVREELRLTAEKLSEADRRKDEFLATLAHELRNPLAPIRTGLEAIKFAMDDPEMRERIRGTMVRQTEQMVHLIDDLLDVSRITQGKLHLRLAQVSLKDVIESAVEATQPFIQESHHHLSITLPEEPVVLNADPTRLAQVFSNLLHNASKYTRENGHIWLNAKTEDQQIIISVKDDGIGIPAEMKELIFEMFGQIEPSFEGGYTGLGIGLTLVKSIVDMHGGTIQVHSEGENKGSEFTIELPFLIHETEQALQQEEVQSVKTLPKSTTLRILVVDDNQAAATMLKLILEMFGYEIQVAHDGLEALSESEVFLPDVILMDLGMPNMDGYTAARHIREQPWGAKLLLVALSGWGQSDDKDRTREAGFDHHLVKPVEPAVLKELLESYQPDR